jgi:molecular chaperone DnaK
MKVNFGIYIGTSSASIAKMEAGEFRIYPSDTQRDNIPIAVCCTKKGILTGDKAFNAWKTEKHKGRNTNSFIEFSRTIGTNISYYSNNLSRSFTSEELLAEVIITLTSFVDDENVEATVITVPAVFEMNQINAVRKAGFLAGLKQIEIITEEHAAALFYGIDSKRNTGYSLIYKLTSSSFSCSLIKSEDGIIKIIDSDGNQFLGSSICDEAIVESVFFPYLKNKYSINSILNDAEKLNAFKERWKPLAEDVKKQLTFDEEFPIVTEIYEMYGEDDEGEEFEIDLTITRNELKGIIEPYIQQTIDFCNNLLKRNNLTGHSLNDLILVGKPTLSPIVREMLKEQIKSPNTSIDYENAIVEGAAIYASTIDLTPELINYSNNTKTIKLHIDYESMVVGAETFVTIKTIDSDKVVFAEISRGDNTFKSERVEIDSYGEVLELALVEKELNEFIIQLYDDIGNKLVCEPNKINIEEGTVVDGIPLPHSICVEVFDQLTQKIILKPIAGLEKNKTLPAVGTWNDFRTKKTLRPGMDDFIDIPIYQGEPFTKAVLNNHVSTIRITGNDLPVLLAENSVANLTIEIDRSNIMSGKVNFIDIDFEMPFEVNTNESKLTDEWLDDQINETENILDDLDFAKKEEVKKDLNKVKNIFENKKTEAGRLEARSELQKVAKVIDDFESKNEWPKLEDELKEEYYRLEKANNDLGNDKTTQLVNHIKSQLEEVIKKQDVKLGNALIEDIINQTNRIDSINEKYDREYLQLYENGEMTLLEVKQSLEEVNRQNGVVYKEILVLLNQEKKNITKENVEELLFKLTEDGLISAKPFQDFFEQLFLLTGDKQKLENLYNDIKTYESK